MSAIEGRVSSSSSTTFQGQGQGGMDHEDQHGLNFQKFQSPDFDVNSWFSSVFTELTETQGLSSKDAVKLLAQQLDSEIGTTNGEIRKITEQIIQQVPKISRDIEVTQRDIGKLQEDMDVGMADVENVQRQTTSSMSTLEKLDNIKNKLQATSTALQEADKWSSLAKQIEQLLDSGDVGKSYECIMGMENTLSVLNQSPTEDRRLILEEMKNRLEALATKHLIHAFDTNNMESAQYFFTMFTNIERSQQFVKYFQSSEKIKISQEWRKLIELLTFKEASVKFYDGLIDHWHVKLQWCRTIFTDEASVNPSNVLLDLYTDAIRTLDPSLQFCFESETKKVRFIDLLIHFNQTTHRYALSMKQLMETHYLKPDEPKVSFFTKVLFQPFLAQYSKYSKYHESTIISRLKVAASASTSESAVPLLQDRIESSKRLLPEIILNIKECEEKVTLFNAGFGYLHFGKGLNSGLERYVEWNQDIFRTLEKSINNPESHRNLLENTLAFAEICGEIAMELTKLDQILSTSCARIFGKMTSSLDKTNPWEDYWGFYLDSTIRSEILQFVQKKETLLGQAVNQMKRLCCDATQLVLRVTAEPVETQLKKSFSLQGSSLKEAIPSEYITQAGEYLMLLPQNLDPFLTSDNSSISFAFDQAGDEDGRSPVDFILLNLSTSICETYLHRILKCTYLTEAQAKQLAQDIDYLGSVLEDLGLKLTVDLTHITKLLKNYGNLGDESVTDRIPPRLVAAIKGMRHKPLTS